MGKNRAILPKYHEMMSSTKAHRAQLIFIATFCAFIKLNKLGTILVSRCW